MLFLVLCLFSPISSSHAKSKENESECSYPYQIDNDVHYFSSQDDREKFVNSRVENVARGKVERTLVNSSEKKEEWVTIAYSKVSKYVITSITEYSHFLLLSVVNN